MLGNQLSFFQQQQLTVDQPIERIVCSGGGARGVVYPGSYKALEETGILKGVKRFAGASAGSITATLMALGMPTDTFRKTMLGTNLVALLGKSVGYIFAPNAAGISFITRDGKPLEAIIRLHIINQVRSFLDTVVNSKQLAHANKDFGVLLNKFQSNSPVFTFGDLAILNRLFPEQFKFLTIPAVRFPNGEIQIFNSERTPNVEIALACRASCSIPVFLEPVKIEINGETHAYIDGGFYDNLPTDYFDTDASGSYIKNIKPKQTLVFAFSDGINNNKGILFNTLYGGRWDETISDAILEIILEEAYKKCKQLLLGQKKPRNPSANEATVLKQAIAVILKKHVTEKNLNSQESILIQNAVESAFNNLLLKPQTNRHFWILYRQEKSELGRIKLLSEQVKKKMKPLLYLANSGWMERMKRNDLTRWLGDLTVPYDNMLLKEAGFHKLRSEYPLRTVELRIGTIRTTDFDYATKVARVMDALGYLDTINHITNHDLHQPNLFDADQFYVDIVHYFEHIYCGVLQGSGADPKRSSLYLEMTGLRASLEKQGKSNETISRQLYQLIKEKVEIHIHSAAAFALTRAVEFRNHSLTADELFKETYEESFKRSSFFSISRITGECTFRSSTLHEALRNKSMFELYKNKAPRDFKTRTDQVYLALHHINEFRQGSLMSLSSSASGCGAENC